MDRSMARYLVLVGAVIVQLILRNYMGDRLCEKFDQVIRPTANLLERELCDADDDEAEWWIPVNSAAVKATKATLGKMQFMQLILEVVLHVLLLELV